MAGYSGTPLEKKLGLKDGQNVLFVALPDALAGIAASRDFGKVVTRKGWRGIEGAGKGFDLVHAFTGSARELEMGLTGLQDAIASDGMIWISWPKRASGVATDLTEDVVRAAALRLDLVDVKVAAVDEVWSGLKLVIRKERRNAHRARTH